MFKKIIGFILAFTMITGMFAGFAETTEEPKIVYIGGFYNYTDAKGEVHSNGTAAMMYTDTDVKSEKLVLLPRNSEVELLEDDYEFCLVKYSLGRNTYVGYVESRYIVYEPEYAYVHGTLDVAKGLYLRTEPTKKASVVTLMPNKTHVVIVYYINGWAKMIAYIDNVEYTGYAYVNGARLKGEDGTILNDKGEIVGYNVETHVILETPAPTATPAPTPTPAPTAE